MNCALAVFQGVRVFTGCALCVFPPLGHGRCYRLLSQASGLHRASDEGADSASECRRRALAIPDRLAKGQHQLQSHRFCILPEICCYGHLPPLPFWCTGPLDLEPGRYLSAARVAVPCLHRSPEFLAVPLALPGLVFGVGKLCKAKLYEYPRKKPKAEGRSWLSVGRRGENSGEWCWAHCLTGSGRRAASAPSAVGTLTMGVWLSAIGIASRPPCRSRLGTRLDPQGQSPVAASAANRPCLAACGAAAFACSAHEIKTPARAISSPAGSKKSSLKAAGNGCATGEAGGQPCAQRTANLFIVNFGTSTVFATERTLNL